MTRESTGPREERTALVASVLLTGMLFLLSADLLFVRVAGYKLKLGYFLVLALWLLAPGRMFATVRLALRQLPWYVWLPLAPLAVSVATSAAPLRSVAWSLWLAFDAFTVATVFAMLKVHGFSGDRVRTCVAASLGLMTIFGVVQFIAIYGFGHVIFQPQKHFDIFRINGLSGWPHFFNIFAFLLLPVVLVQRNPPRWVYGLLILAAFMLVQTTAKTGWVLFVALGLLLLVLDPRIFRRTYLAFLLPVTLVALLIPTPSSTDEGESLSGGEKISTFSADLNIAEPTTSGHDRVLISLMGLNVFAKHPWFGVGPRAYDIYVFTRFDEELPGVNKLDATGGINAKNENIWVEFLAETGILFTLSFLVVIGRALLVPGWRFANRLHLGSWIALVLYFAVSGQFSQTGLLTLVYAVFGIYFYARGLTVLRAPSAPPATVLPDFGTAPRRDG